MAEAWGVFDAAYLANMPGIVSVIHGVMAQGFKNWAAGNNQPFNEPLILEKALTKAHPEFMIATQGLKKAFDKVQGMGIVWNHWQRGEPIDSEETLLSEHLILRTIQRGEPTYPELSGVIVGHIIGPDPYLGGFNAWINIAEGRQASHYSLFEMYGIRISEVSDSSVPDLN